jgi:hypothetical protein
MNEKICSQDPDKRWRNTPVYGSRRSMETALRAFGALRALILMISL